MKKRKKKKEEEQAPNWGLSKFLKDISQSKTKADKGKTGKTTPQPSRSLPGHTLPGSSLAILKA